MNTNVIFNRSWSTSSYGDNTDTSALELSALQEHLKRCQDSHGHLLALRCTAQSMRGFVEARIVTTLVAITLLIGIASLVL